MMIPSDIIDVKQEIPGGIMHIVSCLFQNVSDILSGSIEQRKEVDIILTSMRNIVRWIVLTLASMPVYLDYVNTIRWGK